MTDTDSLVNLKDPKFLGSEAFYYELWVGVVLGCEGFGVFVVFIVWIFC